MTDSIADMNWSSFSGAAEDRNDSDGLYEQDVMQLAVVLWGIEARNEPHYREHQDVKGWRSPSRATEDRNAPTSRRSAARVIC